MVPIEEHKCWTVLFEKEKNIYLTLTATLLRNKGNIYCDLEE